MEKLLHSRADAALLLGVSLRHLDYLLKSGAVRSVKIGKRTLIKSSDLVRLARCGARMTPYQGGRRGK
jgi:excisionase family DNA binding protein